MARRPRLERLDARDSNGNSNSNSSSNNTLKRQRTTGAPPPAGEEPTPWLVVSSALHAAQASLVQLQSNASVVHNTHASSMIGAPQQSSDGHNGGSNDANGNDDDNGSDDEGDGGDGDGDQDASGFESFPRRFFSWSELQEYIYEFGENTYQLFRKRSSVTAAARNLSIKKRVEARKRQGGRNFKDPPLIPDEWEHYSKTYVCTHGLKNHPRGEGLRTHASIRDTGCTAKIQATLGLDKAVHVYCINTRVTGSHNHPVNKHQYYSYAENRRITDPTFLRDIDEMSARGEFPKAILSHIAKRMRETTGAFALCCLNPREECVYKLKDIRNIISRLKKERSKQTSPDTTTASVTQPRAVSEITQQAAAMSAATPESAQQIAAPHAVPTPSTQQTAAVQAEQSEGSSLSAAANDREVTPLSESSSLQPSLQPRSSSKVSLARLEILLDSAYSYRQAHKDIEQVVIGATEMIPKTISGFKHEILELSPSEPREDVDFVLPKHALAGCEAGIVEFCRAKGLYPQSVGVKLPVTIPGGSQVKNRVSTLSSRQLRIMKRFYLVRHSIAETKKAMEWIKSKSFSAYPSAPFDEYAHYTKDLFVHALKLLPLMRTVIRGQNVDANVHFGFTDAIHGASLLKFGSNTNIDVDCVKAVLLHMHARFHAKASFISPSFMFETDLRERCSRATTYGAFLYPKDFVAGLSQLQSSRWGGFFFDCAKKVCYLCAPNAAEHEELQTAVAVLLRGLNAEVEFETSSGRGAASTTTASNDSGILALLFVECMLLNTTWGDNPIDSFDYFRVRYMMQALQVVNKQDVNEIAW